MTRSPKIGNTPVLPNTWRLRRVKDTKFGTDASNEMLLNAAKCQDYSFYRFWVLKGRPKRGDSLPPPLSTQIRVNIITSFQIFEDLQDLFEDLRIYKEKVSVFYIQWCRAVVGIKFCIMRRLKAKWNLLLKFCSW